MLYLLLGLMVSFFQDVSLAALYVSTKMNDTLKKPREILMASYAVRFPEQAAKSKSIGGEVDMDPAVRLISSNTYYVLITIPIGRRGRQAAPLCGRKTYPRNNML